MPYFVYKIHPENRLEYLESFSDYRPAKQKIREERKALPADSPLVIRMMHAKNQSEAERLLTAPRDNRIIGDD